MIMIMIEIMISIKGGYGYIKVTSMQCSQDHWSMLMTTTPSLTSKKGFNFIKARVCGKPGVSNRSLPVVFWDESHLSQGALRPTRVLPEPSATVRLLFCFKVTPLSLYLHHTTIVL